MRETKFNTSANTSATSSNSIDGASVPSQVPAAITSAQRVFTVSVSSLASPTEPNQESLFDADQVFSVHLHITATDPTLRKGSPIESFLRTNRNLKKLQVTYTMNDSERNMKGQAPYTRYYESLLAIETAIEEGVNHNLISVKTQNVRSQIDPSIGEVACRIDSLTYAHERFLAAKEFNGSPFMQSLLGRSVVPVQAAENKRDPLPLTQADVKAFELNLGALPSCIEVNKTVVRYPDAEHLFQNYLAVYPLIFQYYVGINLTPTQLTGSMKDALRVPELLKVSTLIQLGELCLKHKCVVDDITKAIDTRLAFPLSRDEIQKLRDLAIKLYKQEITQFVNADRGEAKKTKSQTLLTAIENAKSFPDLKTAVDAYTTNTFMIDPDNRLKQALRSIGIRLDGTRKAFSSSMSPKFSLTDTDEKAPSSPTTSSPSTASVGNHSPDDTTGSLPQQSPSVPSLSSSNPVDTAKPQQQGGADVQPAPLKSPVSTAPHATFTGTGGDPTRGISDQQRRAELARRLLETNGSSTPSNPSI
jgi:hypothetical protein